MYLNHLLYQFLAVASENSKVDSIRKRRYVNLSTIIRFDLAFVNQDSTSSVNFKIHSKRKVIFEFEKALCWIYLQLDIFRDNFFKRLNRWRLGRPISCTNSINMVNKIIYSLSGIANFRIKVSVGTVTFNIRVFYRLTMHIKSSKI